MELTGAGVFLRCFFFLIKIRPPLMYSLSVCLCMHRICFVNVCLFELVMVLSAL